MTAPEAAFHRREPVAVLAAVSWALVNVGAIIVGHTHLFTASQWNAVSTYLTPLITAAITAYVAKFLRDRVSPEWKRLTGHDLPSEVTDELDPDAAAHRPAAETVAEGAVSAHKAVKLAGHPSPNAG